MSESVPISLEDVAREQLPWLYSLARRLAVDHAEDVVLDCLLRAYKAFPKLRDPRAASAWFRQILISARQ